MCGVIGYVGRRDAAQRLLSGLERLEYRGYDSAGICLLTADGIELIKAVGKLESLKRKTGSTATSTTGIGHTRWATHGRVTEENAHPLLAGDHDDLAVVLNGIIENHGEIRRRLAAEGEKFASETDAEVVSHLVRRAYRGSLVDAVRMAYHQLEGDFAFVVAHREQPGLLVGTRRRCPLLVGVGDDEMFLASSISAFVARHAPSDANRGRRNRRDHVRTGPRDHRRWGDTGARGGCHPMGRRRGRALRTRDVHAQGDPRAA